MVVDEVDEVCQLVGIRAGQHAVAEVEDVSGPPRVLAEDPAGAFLDPFPGPEEEGRVEIALDGSLADEAPALGQRDPPVEADDVAAGRRLEAQDPRGADPEVGGRTPSAAIAANRSCIAGHTRRS